MSLLHSRLCVLTVLRREDAGKNRNSRRTALNTVGSVAFNEKQFEVRTPDVTIKVSPERAGLIETRVIDGVSYILIRADDGVQVNGVDIKAIPHSSAARCAVPFSTGCRRNDIRHSGDPHSLREC